MAIYMDYEGVPGSSTSEGFEKLIVLNSCSFGVQRNVSMSLRSAQAREASEPSISEVTVTKLMDSSSPKLFVESVASDLKNTVKIHFTTTTAKKVTEYLLYTLTNAGVSHYSVSAGPDEIPMETLVLNFTKFEKKFTPMDPGISGTPEAVGYDLAAMKTV
jgi:type VI secretion system secreted protein Hcp